MTGIRKVLGLVMMVALGAGWTSPAMPASSDAAAPAHHRHHSSHDDHCRVPADGQCVGHLCCFSTGPTAAPPEIAPAGFREVRIALVPFDPGAPRGGVDHLLPFAQAPPAEPVRSS